MCVPDGVQSVSRVCFFYRENMDGDSSHHIVYTQYVHVDTDLVVATLALA